MPITSTKYFNPKQLNGLALWLDGADPAGNAVIPETGILATWVDKSGGGINAVAGTGVYPQYTTSYLNGLGVVGLTDPADYFTVANNLNSTSLTYVFLMKPTVANTGNKCGILSTDTAGLYGRSVALNNMIFEIEVYNGFTATSITTNATTWYIVSVVFNGTSSVTFSYNGNISTYGGSGTGTNSSGLTIGSYNSSSSYTTFNANFYLAEVMVYTTALSQSQFQQAEGYLAQKWGLTGSLAGGHPGLTQTLYGTLNKYQIVLTKTPYYKVFSPKQIEGLALWLDGLDPAGNSVVPANNATIATWTDKSGNGNNATGGVSPTYNSSSKSVVFNGSSWLSTPYSSVPANETVFVVFNTTSTAVQTNSFMIGPSTSGGRLIMSVNENDGFGLSFKIGAYGIANGSRLTEIQNQIYLGTTTVASTTSYVYLNGNQGPSSTLTYSGSGTTQIGTAISGVAIYIGNIYEIIIFNVSISTTQRQQVESYLAQKWGLVSSLPTSGHINNTFPAGSPDSVQLGTISVKTGTTTNPYSPGIPTVNTPTNTDTTLNLTWNAPTSLGTITGYIVYILESGSLVSGSGIGTGGTQNVGKRLSATFSPMTSSVPYSFYVVAVGPGGTSDVSTTSSTVTYTPPLYTFTGTLQFTPAGATGRNGPTLSQCVSAYTATFGSWVSNTSYFNMTTAGYQCWTVPVTRSYTIVCAGAGSYYSKAGWNKNGLGIVITTTVNLTQGQILSIVVGQISGSCFGGGYGYASGGGGGSFVALGTTPSTATAIVVAGGGGGAWDHTITNTLQDATSSSTANSGYNGASGGSAGGGGSQSGSWSGGGGGFTGDGANGSTNTNAGGKSFTNGAIGGANYYSCAISVSFGGFGGGGGTHGNSGGGGGGGGYSGGGSGPDSGSATGGGGGSYLPSGATVTGTNNTDGYVYIT